MTWKTIYCPDCDRRISNNALGRAAHFRSKLHAEAILRRAEAEAERKRVAAEHHRRWLAEHQARELERKP